MLERRENESVTEFTIRRMRAQFLDEARDRLMSLEVDLDTIAPEHRFGARCGFASMRSMTQQLLTNMIEE